MIFTETPLKGAFVIGLERREDERGYFARAFCRHEFAAHGLNDICSQTNVSSNFRKGTLRGLHFQYPPAADAKLMRCTRGAILDVIVDLRPESETFLRHFSIELSEDNALALYVPERFGHGHQVLCDGTNTSYQASDFYTPAACGGFRYDDPRLAIHWPLPVSIVSAQDLAYPSLDRIEGELHRRMSGELAA